MIPAMVVPVLTRPDLLHRMLASIDYPVGDLVVIDNGRCITDLLVVPQAERLHVLSMPTNLGVPASWNLGVKATPFAPWWLIVNFDVVLPPGALEQFAAIETGGVVLSGGAPPWCCFALHDEAVQQVGLFDESFHPAYFEDLDYARRCHAAGIPVIESGIAVHHDNSSTLRSGYDERNGHTFGANQSYYHRKVDTGDLSEGRWSLERRRALSWD